MNRKLLNYKMHIPCSIILHQEFMDIKVGFTLDDSKRLDNSSVEDSGDDLYFEIGKEEMHDVAMVCKQCLVLILFFA